MLKTENDVSIRRYIAFNILLITVFSILIVKFFQLQIVQYNQYKEKANINSIRVESLNAPRGSILDRDGEIIVDNAPTYALFALPNVITNIDSIISIICQLINLDSIILSENYQKYYNGYFTPVKLIKDLTFEQISRLEEHNLDLPGIDYKQIQERHYASDINGSHFLGYVVDVDKTNIRDIPNANEYSYGDLIGWSGLEKSYEEYLRDLNGVEYKAIDVYGRIIGEAHGRNKILPKPGKDLVITIDSKLQKFVEELMNGKRGCAVISDPETGEIFSFVNSPSYSPDLFTGVTISDEWNQILNDPNKPLLNRITSGLYPPGSTLKMITLAYILEHRVISPDKQIYCSGKYRFGNRTFRCWNEAGHGYVNLDKALIESCDVYFYNVIQNIPLDDWAELCRQFGFGEKTGIDLPSESYGNVPDKKYFDLRYGAKGWTKGLKLNIAIGQGETLVTPIQLLTYINLFFTNGHTKQPHFAESLGIKNVNIENISKSTWDRFNNLLYRVVNDKKGTGKTANPHIEGLKVAGKTGTSENPHGKPHAWFIGYAVKDDIKRSFVILLENAGHGGDEAAPIVRQILSYIYKDSNMENNVKNVIDSE
ncbi:penicillin-binding protein 2 [bacterium]|nr:penicillin-binding protein 2 [bacterium]